MAASVARATIHVKKDRGLEVVSDKTCASPVAASASTNAVIA